MFLAAVVARLVVVSGKVCVPLQCQGPEVVAHVGLEDMGSGVCPIVEIALVGPAVEPVVGHSHVESAHAVAQGEVELLGVARVEAHVSPCR